MKNRENLQAILRADREAYRAFCKSREDAVQKLAEIKHATNSPEETAREFIAAVEQATATEIIATMVICSEWDGRISRQAKEWAASIEHAWNSESALWLNLYPDAIGLHKAHLDQIAVAMARITA